MAASAEELEKMFSERSQEPQTEASPDELDQMFEESVAPNYPTPMGPRGPRKEETDLLDEANRLGANLTVGLSRLFGMPGDITKAVYGQKLSPTTEDIQGFLAKGELTYPPGEEPDDLSSRIFQELGIAAVPVAGTMGRGGQLLSRGVTEGKNFLQKGAIYAAQNPGKTVAIETTASAGAGGGGMFGEEMFPENPVMGRALGELTGGITGGYIGAGGGLVQLWKGGQKTFAPFTKAGGRERAVSRVGRAVEDPRAARTALKQTEEFAGEVPLDPAQRTGDPFMAQLRNAVSAENDLVRERFARETAEASRKLKEIAERTGDPEDVRAYLDKRMQLAVAKSMKSASAIRGRPPIDEISRKVRKELEDTYDVARDMEKKVWRDVPGDLKARPESAKRAWKEELEDITEGADKKELPDLVKQKLGRLKKNKKTGEMELTKGGLGENPSAKALHQFYSALGRQLRSEEATKGYNANTVRMLKKVRASVLEDLEEVPGGEKYREALDFSRDLNKKFTEGSVGEVLGFARAGGPTNTTETMEALMGHSGERQRNAVKQLLEATPNAAEDVKDYVRNRFVDATYNPSNNTINSNNASTFMKKYRPLLREFPELREELVQASKDQRKVDDLLGVSDFYQHSPAVRQKRAAGIYLQSDPGEEIQRVISSTKGTPKSVATAFRELTNEVKKDETGKALKGLKRAFTEYTMAPSGIEDASGEFLVNGKEMIRRINSLETSVAKSGMFEKKEIDRLKKIAKLFENIQTAETAGRSAEGIIGDKADAWLNAISRYLGANLSRLTPSGNAGVGLQEAQLGSGIMRKMADSLTVRGATNLLTEAVQDAKLYDDLLKDTSKLGIRERERLMNRVLQKLEPPKAAALPAASTAARGEEE